jgi:hypothetical protein
MAGLLLSTGAVDPAMQQAQKRSTGTVIVKRRLTACPIGAVAPLSGCEEGCLGE